MKKTLSFIIISMIIAALVLTTAACGNEPSDVFGGNSNGNSVQTQTVSYTVKEAPTLTEQGSIVSSDGDVVSLPTLNDQDYYYSVISQAACTTEGKALYVWKTSTYGTFQFEQGLAIDPDNHVFALTDYVAATQSADGYRILTCDNCGATERETLVYVEYDSTKPTVITYLDNTVTIDNDNGAVTAVGADVIVSSAGEYALKGRSDQGSFTVNVGDDDKVTIDLEGLTLSSANSTVIYVENADKTEISVKKDTVNVIADLRESTADEDAEGGAIYLLCDAEIKGKGSLTVTAEYNNGIQSKDDLEIKNLTLYVKAVNNAIKGNDSLTITSGCITAISVAGDALKTSNSGLSSKNKQKGTLTISGGTLNLYSACDGIDAAYNVEISQTADDTPTIINISTDKYSEYSGEVTATSQNKMYIKNTTSAYNYSVLFQADGKEDAWVNATYLTSQTTQGRGGRTYYYYSLSKPSGYSKMTVYIYTSSQTQGTENAYASQSMSINTAYDTVVFNGNNYSGWSNYTTTTNNNMNPMFGGGGNKDKSDHSAKGIKAGNEAIISGGTITITAYDDGIHANNEALDSGVNGVGNVTITGGTINISSNDDGVHAADTLRISGGQTNVDKSYEGVEATKIVIEGGSTIITASDDGVNAAGTSPSVTITGGYLDITLGSGDVDGIDSNGSFTMSGGLVVTRGAPQSTSNMSTGLDCDGFVTMTGGTFIQFGAIESSPTLSGCYTLRYGTSASSSIFGGGRPGGGGTTKTSYVFAKGEWTIEGLNVTVNNSYNYYCCTIYSSALTKGTSYVITNGSTQYTATTS